MPIRETAFAPLLDSVDLQPSPPSQPAFQRDSHHGSLNQTHQVVPTGQLEMSGHLLRRVHGQL